MLPPSAIQDFSQELQAAVSRRGWKELMPVQAGVSPYLLANRDVIVQSRTGSGKTAAFLLPLCERLKNAPKGCQALILVPTRELAQQVYNEFQLLTTEMQISAVAVYGGTSYRPQLEAFRNGVNLIIGTPGRLLDHLIKGTLNLKTLRYLVFDEADEMLSMGFYRDMVRIGEFLPTRRCAAMFSATMPDSVKRLAVQFLHNPDFLTFSGDGVHVSEMDHIFYVVDPMQKDRALMRIIELEDPDNAIIFCNTRNEVEYVAAILKRFGYDADQISGDLSQNARELVMAKLKQKTLRFLVATDIAARGIDISNLEYVFIYDMHKDTDQYIHRAGRTARAGNRGVAISLVNQIEAVDLKKFAKEPAFRSKNDHCQPKNTSGSAFLKACRPSRRQPQRCLDCIKERMKRYHGLLSELNDHEHGEEMLLMLIDSFHQQLIRIGRGIDHEPVTMPVSHASTRKPVQERHNRSHGGERSGHRGGERGGQRGGDRGGQRGPRRRN